MNVDGIGDIADAVDQILRCLVPHHSCQRRIGVEQRAARRGHVDPVDRSLKQFAVAFLGKALLGERMHRRLTRGVGIDEGTAEHFGGAGDIADLVVDICGRDRRLLFARGERSDRAGDGLERTDGAAHHKQCRNKPDQNPQNPQDDALPSVMGNRLAEIDAQQPAPAGADLAQQFGHPSNLPAFDTQHVLVDFGDLGLRLRDRNDLVGVCVDGAAERRLVDGKRPHALGRLLGRDGIVRQQRLGDLVLRSKQAARGLAVGHFGDRLLEPLAHRRQCCDQLGAPRKQRGNAPDSFLVVGKPLGNAVDHVLLFGSKLQPRLLQKRAQGRCGLANPIRAGVRIGDEIAGSEPQRVHAPIDLGGDVAEALQTLQLTLATLVITIIASSRMKLAKVN